MSKLAVAHRERSLLPDTPELFTDFPSWVNLVPTRDPHPIRLEEGIEGGHYVIRAELPGIDPTKDFRITVTEGPLTITLGRTELTEPKGRSEAHDACVRSVTLPTGADKDGITASYCNGILSVSVAMPETPPGEKHIPVRTGR